MDSYHRDGLHSRPSRSRAPPSGNSTRRTFGNHGFQFTVETTSFPGLGRSFTSPEPFEENTPRETRTYSRPPRRSARPDVWATAFNLVGDFADAAVKQQQAAQAQANKRESRRRSSRRQDVGDTTNGDEEYFEFTGDSRSGPRPRGLFATMADTYINNAHNDRDIPRREQSPARRSRRERRKRGGRSRQNKSYNEEPWSGRFTTHAEEFTDEEVSEDTEVEEIDSDDFYESQHRRSSTSANAKIIAALEVAREQAQVKLQRCKARLQKASSLPGSDSTRLQSFIDDIRTQEKALAAVEKDLERAKAGVRAGPSPQRSAPHHSRPPPSRRATQADPLGENILRNFEAVFTRRSSLPAFTAEFGNVHRFPAFGSAPLGFGSLFNDPVFGTQPFFGMPREFFTGRSFTTQGPRAHFPPPRAAPPPIFTPPKPKPPPTLLHPQEAKALFQTYNQRWNALIPTDPSIPYPCRGFQARSLAARDTLWAPHLRNSVSTWSDEAVMQANAQAFFLGVVGLAPTYSEAPATGTIVRGFDKTRASPAQLRELIDVLKKEKTRWHSDRLGRRNGGGVDAGVNEALQRDERARAVFHAVCELMEVAQ